ncbi:adenylosuccinate synthase [Yersinia ruckeri]|uniref:adenylosuccinate synthase n=1 Tax=Yersinia ruckeri TaxID=29486 RepID=UPI0020BFB533|nr:adenylosuccinate synthase [Yersinia ruckeri]MCW6560066.1 adenylosuccinate synthase [Yersinia ruckeri]UZY16938.1 adenylosuccinate synthase [Yersinia ruckeri]
MTITHNELNAIAVKWLKRAESGNGPGCQVALTEVGGLYGGERADAFGYRWGWDGGSVVVESKISRSDFLADRTKPHRNGTTTGMGTYRYYICPEGLISIEDLPFAWGLLWVNARGHVKLKAGHVCCKKAHGHFIGRSLSQFWQHDADLRFELDMLAHSLVRFGDPEEAKTMVRRATREASRLATELNNLREKARKNSVAALELSFYKEKYGELTNDYIPSVTSKGERR